MIFGFRVSLRKRCVGGSQLELMKRFFQLVAFSVLSLQLLQKSFAADFDRWQRHREFLMERHQRVCFPPPETISVNNETIKLPLPAVEPVRTPSKEELEYLVGFFDGDGCVTMNSQNGRVHLSIGQSVDSVEVLLRFRSLLGGSIGRQSARTGSQKAVVQWQVYGSKMAAAAETLSRVPSMKQAQLLIAACGTVAKGERVMVAQELRKQKERECTPQQLPRCSWPYFAGFFDAEGSIRVLAHAASCTVAIKQVNPCVLVQLQRFLHANGLQSWCLYHYSQMSLLVCNRLGECKRLLKELLVSGLLVKAEQAQLAIALTTERHLEVREAIMMLNGNQNRYNCLDSAGVVRAKKMERLRAKIRRREVPSAGENDALQRELEELREEHKLKTLISQCILLRKDIRRALREGGSYKPASLLRKGSNLGV